MSPVSFQPLCIPSQRRAISFNIPDVEEVEESATVEPYIPPSDRETEAALKDWIEFASNCGIVSNRKVIPFVPYGFQRELFRVFWQNYLTIVGKPRQHGLTETFANVFLFRAHKDPAYSAAIFSKNQGDTRKIAERVKRMAITHPDVHLSKSNTEEIQVEGGGSLLFRPATVDGPRGLSSLSDILLDEFAFIRDAEQLWTAATPAQQVLGDAARIAVVSTPPPPESDPNQQTFYMKMMLGDNGDRDLIQIANQMRAGDRNPVQWWKDKSGAIKFLVHWKAHPIYSSRENYLEKKRSQLKISESTCNREYDLAFDEKDDRGIVDIDWFGRYSLLDIPDNPILIIQSWDTASKANKTSSHTAGITIMLDGGRFYIVDLVHKKMLAPDVEKAIRNAAHKWRPNLILIEDKSSGEYIIPSLKGDDQFRYPVKAVQPFKVQGEGRSAKLIRFEQELGAIRDEGKVFIPAQERAPKWLPKFISAIEKVGIAGADMDVPDSLSQVLRHLRLEYSDRAGNGKHYGMALG